MIKSKNIFNSCLVLSIVIAFTILSQVRAGEVKRVDGVKKHKKIEEKNVTAERDVTVEQDPVVGKDVAVRTKTLKKSDFRISRFTLTPLEYHQAESKKYKLQALIDVIEKGNESEESSLSGSSAGTLPKVFSLRQNYPNPFNPSTTIQYEIPEQDNEETKVLVRLNIYSIRGRLVRTLVDEEKKSGFHKVQWDGRDERGELVSSGIYLYRISAGDYVSTRKMTILK